MLIKKLFLITALFIWGFSQQAPVMAQKAAPEQVQYFAKGGKVFKVTGSDTTEVQGGEAPEGITVVTPLPDSVTFKFGDSTFTVNLEQLKGLANGGKEFYDEVKQRSQETPPQNPLQWILLIVGVLGSARFLTWATNVVKFGGKLVRIFQTGVHPAFFVLFGAGALGVGITFLWGGGSWDNGFFITTWGWLSNLSGLIYLIIKGRKKTPVKV